MIEKQTEKTTTCLICSQMVGTRRVGEKVVYAPHIVTRFMTPGNPECEASWMEVVEP